MAFDPDGVNILVPAGRAISIRGDQVVISDASHTSVGEWRSGRLIFRNASLADVAHDLSLALGKPITLEDGLAMRHFTGIVPVAGNPGQVITQFIRITDLRARRTRDGWFISADTRRPHAVAQERASALP